MMGVGNGGGRGASSRCLPTARGFSLHASCVHPRIRTWTICAVRRDGMCFVSREAASGCAAAGPFQIETPRAGSSRARPRRPAAMAGGASRGGAREQTETLVHVSSVSMTMFVDSKWKPVKYTYNLTSSTLEHSSELDKVLCCCRVSACADVCMHVPSHLTSCGR